MAKLWISVTFFTVCPAAFLASKLSGTPTAADIFCSAADSKVNCDRRDRCLAVSSEDGSVWCLTVTVHLSEVNHPVGLALWDQVIGSHQVDQVQAAVKQKPLQTFTQVFVQNITVGQIHRAWGQPETWAQELLFLSTTVRFLLSKELKTLLNRYVNLNYVIEF